MHKYYLSVLFLLTTLLAGCGESQPGSQATAIQFSSQVSFGDSLSDVGSYNTGIVAESGGGQFTVNGVSTNSNWTALMAAQLGLNAPCAAQVGLDDGTGTASSTNVTPYNHPYCTGYAQGGARVTNAIGVNNAALGTGGFALTVPVATQISNHLTNIGGTFAGDEIIFMLAGANDVFMQASIYAATVGGGGDAATAYTTALTNTATAATELATLVTDQLIANGANYIVLVNIPDISNTPQATYDGAGTLYDALVTTFNTTVATALASNSKVLIVDAYTVNRDQITNPDIYGLSNVTDPVCDLTAASGTSLLCSTDTLTTGADDYYLFADRVHPTPYGYLLLARLVSRDMIIRGWL